jgi:hypothetical protein
MFSPGHTLASATYVIGDAAFIHDTLFMPDSGTARADFPGGSAKRLWRSIQHILALPEETRLFTGHDYQPGGRAPLWESTVAEQKLTNPHVVGKDEAAFVALREERDRSLPMPKLILHALQVNVRGGRLPDPETNGRRYLKFPLDALAGAAWAEARIMIIMRSDIQARAGEAAGLLKTFANSNRLRIVCTLRILGSTAIILVVPTVNFIRLAYCRESRDELPHAGRAQAYLVGPHWAVPISRSRSRRRSWFCAIS